MFHEVTNPGSSGDLRRWFVHHDNAPAHNAERTMECLAPSGINLVAHTPYSPDLAPCDFFLFPKIKKELREKRFENCKLAVEVAITELAMLQNGDLELCLNRGLYRLQKSIDVHENYIGI